MYEAPSTTTPPDALPNTRREGNPGSIPIGVTRFELPEVKGIANEVS